MNNGNYTFYPQFNEYVTLYRGIVRAWIADGTTAKPGSAGKLYAEYVDGLIQELGFVSDYEEAKKYFADLGIQLTYQEWVALLADTPENARKAKDYADQSRIWADGNKLDGTSVQPQNNATFWANEAQGWVNNKDGSVHGYSETNNARYWTEQSKGYTNGRKLNNESIQDRRYDNAQYFKNQAKLWANFGTQGESPTEINNAKYYADQSGNYFQAIDAVARGAYISPITYCWVIWNSELGKWIDSGIDARGIEGPQGQKGEPGKDAIAVEVENQEISFKIDENGHLIMIYGDAQEQPNYFINENGHLIYEF